MKYSKAPAHIRAAIARDGQRWETTDGTPAIVAMGMVVERIQCPECKFHMNKGNECEMCELLKGE